jgi:predicted GTPase
MEDENVVKAVPVSDRPRIKVEITGDQSKVGKTCVGALIVQALRNAGFDDIRVDCEDGDLKTRFLEGVDITRLVPMPGIDVVDRNGSPTSEDAAIWRA